MKCVLPCAVAAGSPTTSIAADEVRVNAAHVVVAWCLFFLLWCTQFIVFCFVVRLNLAQLEWTAYATRLLPWASFAPFVSQLADGGFQWNVHKYGTW